MAHGRLSSTVRPPCLVHRGAESQCASVCTRRVLPPPPPDSESDQPGGPPKPPAHCNPRDLFMSEHLPCASPARCGHSSAPSRRPESPTSRGGTPPPGPAPRSSLAGHPHGWAPPRTRLHLLSAHLCCVPPSVPRPRPCPSCMPPSIPCPVSPCPSHVPPCPRPPPPIHPTTSAGRPGRASVPPAQAGVSPVHWQLTGEPARPPPFSLAETPGRGAGGGCRGRSRPRGLPHL